MALQSFKSPMWKIILGKRYANCKYLVLVFIPHFLTAIFEGGSFAFILYAFSALEGKPPIKIGPLADLDIPAFLGLHLEKRELFYFYIFGVVLFQALRGALNYVALIGTSFLSLKIQIAAQQAVCNQIFKFSFPFVSKYKVGDLSEYVKGPSTFIPYFFEFSNRILVCLFMSLGLISVLSMISLKLTFCTVFLFLLFGTAQKFLIRKISHYSKALSLHLVEFTHQIIQSMQGIRQVHIFQRQTYILKKIETILGSLATTSKRLHLWSNSLPVLNETVSILLVGITLVLGSYILGENEALIASLLTYIALTYRLATRLQIGMSSLGSIVTYFGSIVRLNEILEDQGKEYLQEEFEKKNVEWKESISFQNVSLKYPSRDKWAIENLSFTINKGTTIAFVGLSGAGKSSILDLILGLQRPTSGDIFIDGVFLQDCKLDSWRKQIGVVSQDSFIFHGTVEENIRFGEMDADFEKVKEAARVARADDFIQQLPRGYQTLLGEKGHQLSGGEKQRISLARALLKDPPILILDEATSHLDRYSEKMIQNSMEALNGKKTILIVTHRLSTIVQSDAIFVIEEGKILEKGDHKELLTKNGRYANLWEVIK